MNKTMLGVGSVLLLIGGAAFLFYVLPWIAGTGATEATATTAAVVGPSGVAVVLATFGLAVGSALIGIGLGRWKSPRPSPQDGSPEV